METVMETTEETAVPIPGILYTDYSDVDYTHAQ